LLPLSAPRSATFILLIHATQLTALGNPKSVGISFWVDNGREMTLVNPSFASRLESKPVVVFELRLFVWGQDRYKVAPKATAADAETNAGSVTTTPSLRKTQAVTWMPSRRRAVNQRMVAREPVTEKFGPRSTPTRTALATGVGAWAAVQAT
jgi:hypothetical protein